MEEIREKATIDIWDEFKSATLEKERMRNEQISIIVAWLKELEGRIAAIEKGVKSED